MPGPRTYVHKPTRVDIWEFTLEEAVPIARWMSEGGATFDMSDDGTYLRIETRQGDSRDCHPGDSIVKRPAPTPSGFEFYPVQPDVKDDYQLVDEPAGNGYAPPGTPRCGADCDHGGTCTAVAGHPGDHAAYGYAGSGPYCTWPRDGA